MNLFVLGIFFKNRKTPLVKAANRELSFLLLGLLLIAFLIPFIHIGMPTVPQCTTHIVVQGPLMTGILSIFLVKTHRVIIIFHARQPGVTSRQWFLKQRLQVVAVFTLVIVQITLVTVYVCLKQPVVMKYGYDDITTKYVYVECNYGGGLAYGFTYVYVISIALIGFVMAFRSRHLPSNFRESRHIAASLATTLLVHGAMLPAAPLTHGRINAIITVIALTISPLGQLTFLFFPKCYIILFCPQRNTVRELRRMTLAHMQRRSELNLNCQAVPRLDTIATIGQEGTDSQPQSPTCITPDSNGTQKRQGDPLRSVYFIDDEYAAAMTDDSNENSHDMVNITLHARATFEGIRGYGIHGVDNLAFAHDSPESHQSKFVYNNRKQQSRPRSISAEETSGSKENVQPKHENVSKRKSEPNLNKASGTLHPAHELCVFSLTGTLSASATFSAGQKRCKNVNSPKTNTKDSKTVSYDLGTQSRTKRRTQSESLSMSKSLDQTEERQVSVAPKSTSQEKNTGN